LNYREESRAWQNGGLKRGKTASFGPILVLNPGRRGTHAGWTIMRLIRA